MKNITKATIISAALIFSNLATTWGVRGNLVHTLNVPRIIQIQHKYVRLFLLNPALILILIFLEALTARFLLAEVLYVKPRK